MSLQVPAPLSKLLSVGLFDLPRFESVVDEVIKELNMEQAEALSVELASWYVAGLTKNEEEKKKDKKGKDKDPDGLSELQRETIKKMSADKFGYISEFNKVLGEQLKTRTQEILQDQGGKDGAREEITAEVRKYVEEVFDGAETIKIDRTGQTKQVLEVTKDLKLKLIEKVVKRAYYATPETYSAMLGRSAVHSAYEQGRAEAYQNNGVKMWRFVGPVDERSRPAHSALVGEEYTYGTHESDLAMTLFDEPNCRHRAIPYFDDPDLDTPKKEYEKMKEEAGLYWDDEKEEWAFRE
ncbi:hypothetical protein [Methanosarcina sp.]|uniref:hypothetical protein n=1 Tax=Methanosarcina sp. TaxID=2213 RepID=UPI003BB52075